MSKLNKDICELRKDIEVLVDSKLNEINTTVLSKVVSVSSNEPKVTVEILAKRSYIDKEGDRQYDQLPNLEVRIAYSKGFKPTTKVGDYGVLLIMQSDIEPFLSNEADSPRKYDFADAVFIPFAYEASNVNTDSLIINSDSGEDIDINSGKDLVVTSTDTAFTNTHFSVSNSTDELVDLLGQLCGICATITTNTSTGALLPPIASSFNAIKSKIEAFKP